MEIFKKLFFTFLFTIVLLTLTSPVSSFDFIIPDTGQDLCYDWNALIDCPGEGEDFYGQDGNYTINPPDLTDNGDGTVTDNLTGLTWEQNTEENEPNAYTYNEAITYCDELILGEQNDWRMPTRKEYSTILNFGTTSPSLDTVYFPYYTSVYDENEAHYWTSSEYHDDSSQVWLLRLAFGLVDKTPKEPDPHRVRCVRGATESAASYTDNGNGTVTDNVTGLMWEQKTDDGGSRDKDITYTWKEALAYCESLLLGENDDWRLPNTKELERVVDLGSSSPAINTTNFPNTNNELYWTSTTCSGCHKMKAFAVDFSDGELYYGNKYRNDVYDENYVRCVRHPDPDGDGVIYPNDNCPYVANPGQEDNDTDGAGNVCDNCSQTANPDQEDNDADGAGNACDNCLSTPNGPNLGTCAEELGNIVKGTGVSCISDDDCGSGETCQMSNEDCNDNEIGDACECYADFDGSGDVYPSDLSVFLDEYGRTDCITNPPCEADIDGDGNVYPSDLSVFLGEYGRTDCLL